MAKYKVVLVRAKTLYETTTVEVEAENQRKARRAAIEKGRTQSSLQWVEDPPGPEELGIRVRDWQKLSSEVPPRVGGQG